MVIKRTSKEYKLKSQIEGIKAIYGTLNKKSPDIIYIRAKTKLNGLLPNHDYKEDLQKITQNIKSLIKRLIDENEHFGKYICTFETPERGVEYNKKSYLKYDLYLHPFVIKDLFYYEPIVKDIFEQVNIKLKQLCNEFHLKLSDKNYLL